MTHKQIVERLKDRRAYRATLIQRREDLERKIVEVEKQIAALVPDE
jgi:hypothetical protein